MDALREIGFQKAFKFLLYSFWSAIFNMLIFPQLRVLWLRMFGAHIGSGTIVHAVTINNIYHHGLNNLSIGNKCFIGPNVSFDLAEKIIIGDNVNVGEGVIFSTHLKIGYEGHPLQKYFPVRKAPIRIAEGAFIGVGSILLAGTIIESYAMIAAGTTLSGRVKEWTAVRSSGKNSKISIRLKK